MTIREAVKATINLTGYNELALDMAIIDAGFEDSEDDYDPTYRRAVNFAALDVLRGMLGVQSITEGGYSISYSIAGVQERISYLNGLIGGNGQPKIYSPKLW